MFYNLLPLLLGSWVVPCLGLFWVMPQWSSLCRWPFLPVISPWVEFPVVKLLSRWILLSSWLLWPAPSEWGTVWSPPSQAYTSPWPSGDWTFIQLIVPWKQATWFLVGLHSVPGAEPPLNKAVASTLSASTDLTRAAFFGKFWVSEEGQERGTDGSSCQAIKDWEVQYLDSLPSCPLHSWAKPADGEHPSP